MADGKVVIESKMDNTGLDSGLSEMQSKLDSTSKNLGKVGKDLTKYLTVPIMGAATGAVKMAMDFDASMSEVQAISGATGGDMQKLEALAREMGATTKFSAGEAADGLKYMALAGWDTEQMAAALPAVLDLAAASGSDLGVTSDIVTDALSAFGLEAEDASGFADLLASASSNSNTSVEQMGESFKYVAPVMGALGVSTDDTALALGLMANAGIKGSQAGTQLRTIMTSLIDPTDKQAAAMEQYGVEMVKNADGTIDLKGTMDNLRDTIGDLDEEQQAQAASTIFGKEAMAGALAIVNASEEDYKKLTSATSDYDGAAKAMADTMQDNLKGSLTELKSALSEAAISLGQALVPAIQAAVDWIQNMVDKFNSLDEGTQRNIAVVGLLIAAIGPLILIISKVMGVVSLFSGALAVVTTGAMATTPAMAALAAVIGFIASPAGLAVAALAGITLAGKKLYNHFSQDTIPEIERFGDTVSTETQEAVSNFMDMSEDANVALKELAWGQKEVTQEMVDDMKAKQNEMTSTLLKSIDDRHTQEKDQMVKQFSNIDSLNDEQKNKILSELDTRYEEERVLTQEGHNRINEIMQKAADEGREITKAESKEILAIRDDMTVQAVEMMSQNELEQKAILERMKQNAGTITAAEAVEVAKNSRKKKEDVIKEANEQYDETIAWAIQQRDEAGTMSEQEAADVIAEAERKKNNTVAEAEDMHSKVVAEAKAQAGDTVRITEDGNIQVLSKWETLVGNVKGKATEMKDGAVLGFQQMVQGAKNEMRVMVATMKKSMGDALSAVTDRVKEFFNAGSNIASSIADGIKSGIGKVGDAASSLAQKARDFLPFSPAKEGPLRDLNKLDFGGPIQDSIKKAVPGVRNAMEKMFFDIGYQVNEDVARGLKSNKKATEKAAKDLHKGLEKINKKADYDARKATDDANKEIIAVRKSLNSEVLKITQKAANEGRDLTESEKSKLLAIEKEHSTKVNKINADSKDKLIKIEKDKVSSIEKLQRELTDSVIDWNDKRTDYEEKSMYGQYQKWSKLQDEYLAKDKLISEQIMAQKKEVIRAEEMGNDQLINSRTEALNKLLEAEKENNEKLKEASNEKLMHQKAMYEELNAINDEYVTKVQEINEKLIEQEHNLRQEYQNTVDARADSLYKAMGLFDEVVRKEEVSGEQLIKNLRGQVAAFEHWADDIASLAKRGIDDGLLKELRDMGPAASAEIKALNKMTEEELDFYNTLWKAKGAQARKQAETELEGMKKDTEDQIDGLHKQSEKQLDDLEDTWRVSIQDIRFGVKDEFDPLKSDLEGIGQDAISGMIAGLSSMEGSLMAKASSIADSVRSTIASAFDIHSPSRWMRDEIGKNMMLGWIDGIDAEKNDLINKSQEMANLVKGSIPDTQIAMNSLLGGPGMASMSSVSNNSDNRTTYGDTNITIVSPTNTPSENARQIKRVGKELAHGY